MIKATKRPLSHALIAAAVSAFIAIAARAETVFIEVKPSSAISTAEAAKSTEPVFKCEQVKQGPNINPVKVPGTNAVWTRSVGTGIDNAGDLLAEGKKIYRCKTMQLDGATARMRTTN